jgi:dTDP-4-amino-4,6-dideoxygalactose transaminase
LEYNYAYYPVVFESEVQLLRSLEALGKENIFPRRYFYPSLNLLPYLERKYSCPVSEAITLKIACLPLSAAMEERDVEEIAAIIKKSGKSYA